MALQVCAFPGKQFYKYKIETCKHSRDLFMNICKEIRNSPCKYEYFKESKPELILISYSTRQQSAYFFV